MIEVFSNQPLPMTERLTGLFVLHIVQYSFILYSFSMYAIGVLFWSFGPLCVIPGNFNQVYMYVFR